MEVRLAAEMHVLRNHSMEKDYFTSALPNLFSP